MIRQTAAAVVALGLSATVAFAQPPAAQTNPSASARAARVSPDEPPNNAGPVVERRTERGAQASERKIGDSDIATAPINEVAKVSHHTVTIDGKTIPYTATAGTLTLRSDDGKPIASMFYVAYTADGPKDPNRPVTFSYNGGPGSASLFVHMGLAGPMHVMTDSPNATHNAPFTITENHQSLLDKSDMVFLDAI
ncbi:MAG TPA: hypothetical protein VNW53_19285, partial [Phenylobacterium sp.]|uniref:S10 family serine carboxypeptidase-like protein n=1 Tax=Phenylobacterium sp. TaxID=1871053 RepID=UPI002CFC4AF8|nr:hypothetical protein [Phenylobacterium sp.]